MKDSENLCRFQSIKVLLILDGKVCSVYIVDKMNKICGFVDYFLDNFAKGLWIRNRIGICVKINYSLTGKLRG